MALMLAILVLFTVLSRLPKLDTMRGDLAAVLAPTAECFQGSCVEADPESTFLAR